MDDATYIRRTLDLAARGAGLASPNPVVGAVIVAPDGSIVGEGWHEGPGSPHAEVQALSAAGSRARGASLYVSLEPCNHHGRTAPCTAAILDAGITRVVSATADPNPAVAGGGSAYLRERGLECLEGVLGDEAERQNRPFFTHVRTGRPWVVLKVAATLDGKIAARDGSSTWITSDPSRDEVHRMRAASDAILVGSGTAIADDPRLTVRGTAYRGSPPLRVVVDASGRLPARGNLFDGAAPTLIATTTASPEDVQGGWATAGAEVLVCDTDDEGGVSLPDLFARLGKRDMQSVLVEGGATVADRAVRAGQIDEVVIFFAPKLLGGAEAPGILGGRGFDTLADAQELAITAVERFGPDVKVVADVHRDR
ncbi:MAG: bifunctional diaminohydroxyphosphoribosylaminopyrimidine deaminase/5-amino-6-(5-phosphoribosylamino)uracil reductase RibD [Actinomycetota bacterium]